MFLHYSFHSSILNCSSKLFIAQRLKVITAISKSFASSFKENTLHGLKTCRNF